MSKKIKFHAIAIAAICTVVILAFLIIGPKQSAPTGETNKNKNGNYVHIVNASWGLNCNQAIEEAIRTRANIGLSKDAEGKIIPQEPIKLAPLDNVLTAAKQACEGSDSCNLIASSDSLGTEPLSSCYKKLVVNYRCFEVDRLRSITVDQGERLSIDCSKPEATNAPAAATTP
ncbi:MAG: hypothetical protein ACOYNL_08260 [Rickettsiales bacterium]